MIREDLTEAHERAWAAIAAAGTWLTGAQRVAVAIAARLLGARQLPLPSGAVRVPVRQIDPGAQPPADGDRRGARLGAAPVPLRESMHLGGKEVDVRGVTQGFEHGVDIPHAAALVAFAEAVVARDLARIADARQMIRPVIGEAALVDAAAVVAGFHGFVRIADATGIPYTSAAGGRDVPALREEAGINAFYRVQSTRGAN